MLVCGPPAFFLHTKTILMRTWNRFTSLLCVRSIVKNPALFSDPELNYAAPGIRKEFFNFYIGKLEAESLAHGVALH